MGATCTNMCTILKGLQLTRINLYLMLVNENDNRRGNETIEAIVPRTFHS